MTRSLPPLGWFRAFECAARHQSFTAAADELGLTQSAISQQIRSLETRLGCRLFDRKHRGIGITDEGRKLLPDVTRAINALRTATAPFDLQSDSNVLTVATSVSVAQWYLAPAMHIFMQNNPGINIRLLTAVWPDEISDSTDVQIRFGPITTVSENAQTLGSNQLVLLASSKLFDGKKIVLNNDLLKNTPIIQAVGTSDSWVRSAEKFGLDPAHETSLFVDSHGLSVDFARSGSGIAFTSEFIATPSLADDSLIRVHNTSIEAKDGYTVAVTANARTAIANLFVDWLFQEVQHWQGKLA